MLEYGEGKDPESINDVLKIAKKMSGEAKLGVVEFRGRKMRIISATHYSAQARKILEEQISPEIHDPTEWLFLIEAGTMQLTPIPGLITEVDVARTITEERKIPIYDPIFNPHEPEVLRKYLATRAGKQDSHDKIVALHAIESMAVCGTRDVDTMAIIFGIASIRLQRGLLAIHQQLESNPSSFIEWENNLSENLLKVSNMLSVQILNYYLNQHPFRKEVVFYCGINHASMLDIDIEKIPEELHLASDQVPHIVQARDNRISTKQRKMREYYIRK